MCHQLSPCWVCTWNFQSHYTMSKHDDWQCFSENLITKVWINKSTKTWLLAYWCENKQRCNFMVSRRAPLKLKKKYVTNITALTFFMLWLMSCGLYVIKQSIFVFYIYTLLLIHPFNYKYNFQIKCNRKKNYFVSLHIGKFSFL